MSRQKIRGFIFDLDGVLLDSMGVWWKLGHKFLGKEGIEVPTDLAKSVRSLSLPEAALYFQESFNLTSTIEEIMAKWQTIIFEEYAYKVKLKPGVGTYLRHLAKQNYCLGIATSNVQELTKIALKRENIYNHFQVVKTRDEVERNKNFPDIYLACAQELGIAPEECVVFEDILPGVLSAKKAGMKTVGVYEQYSEYDWAAIKKNADWVITSFTELLANDFLS